MRAYALIGVAAQSGADVRIERLILLPGQRVIDAMGPLIRIGLDQSPVLQIEFLFFAEKFLRARHGFFFRQRSARRFFRESVTDRVERPVGPQNDGELFRLAVAEIAHAPECGGNLPGIDGVDSRNSDSLPQKFIHNRIGDVHEEGGVVIRIWIEATLAEDLVGPRAGGCANSRRVSGTRRWTAVLGARSARLQREGRPREGEYARGERDVAARFCFEKLRLRVRS